MLLIGFLGNYLYLVSEIAPLKPTEYIVSASENRHARDRKTRNSLSQELTISLLDSLQSDSFRNTYPNLAAVRRLSGCVLETECSQGWGSMRGRLKRLARLASGEPLHGN